MKKVSRHVPDVTQGTADRGTEIVERYFNAYGVKRASDLPEEGKVRLHREMQCFLDEEAPQSVETRSTESFWDRLVSRIRGFFAGD